MSGVTADFVPEFGGHDGTPPDPALIDLPCAYCARPSEGHFSIHRDGFSAGPDVPLCIACGSQPQPSCDDIWDRIAQVSTPPARRSDLAARQRRLWEGRWAKTRPGDVLERHQASLGTNTNFAEKKRRAVTVWGHLGNWAYKHTTDEALLAAQDVADRLRAGYPEPWERVFDVCAALGYGCRENRLEAWLRGIGPSRLRRFTRVGIGLLSNDLPQSPLLTHRMVDLKAALGLGLSRRAGNILDLCWCDVPVSIVEKMLAVYHAPLPPELPPSEPAPAPVMICVDHGWDD